MTPSTPRDPYNGAPAAEVVIDGEHASYVLDLNPVAIDLLADLARALRAADLWGAFRVLGAPITRPTERGDIAARIASAPAVHAALQLHIHEHAWDTLREQINDVTYPQFECARDECTRLAETGHELCGMHEEIADRVSAMTMLRGA